jgi:HD-GYP domain-containing protein (c-di-GMP phosphodiesterase class II)
MIKTVKTKDLKVGMYILLPKSWFAHPFIKNEFVINSPAQIAKIIEADIHEVAVDTERSKYEQNEPVKTVIPKNIDKNSLPIIPPDLQEAISNKKMAAPEKAKIIHKHSTVMIQRLMERPSSENITEAKKGIAKVVDVILADDVTNQQLLNITSHDYSTYVHSVNVGLLGVGLSKSLFKNSDAHDMHELGAGFFLHDLGKVKVDINIILKPSVLTDEEIEEMRKHPQYGYDILAETKQLTEECKRIVLQHHERFDGRGYPMQLKGEEIHLYGRICSIADVFDALASKRPYRKGLRPFEALNIMKGEMMEHFHKELFQKFVLLFTS